MAVRGRRRVERPLTLSTRGPPGACRAVTHAGHDGVRRQRPGAAGPAAAQPAVARRGGRHGRVDGHAARADSSRRPGSTRRAVEVVFTGADHGTQGGVEQDYERSLTVADAMRDEVLLAYEMNGAAAAAAARLPAPAGRPRLVRHDEREVAAVDHRGRPSRSRATRCGPTVSGSDEEDDGTPVTRIDAARADGPARLPGLLHARADARRRAGDAGGPRLVRPGAASTRVEVSVDGGTSWSDARCRSRVGALRVARLDLCMDRRAG